MEVRKRRVPLALLTSLALVGAGCGEDDSGGSAGSSASNGGKKYTIGLVPFSSANATSNQGIQGVQAVAKKNGWETSVIDAGGAPDKAVGAIQTLVQRKVDVIVTTVFPPDSVSGGALAAKAAGIPIASLGGGTGNGVQASWDVGTESGKRIAERMIKDTGGDGALLALGYKLGLPCQQREKALTDSIKSASYDLDRQEVPIPGQVEGGTKFAQAWLASNPKNAGKATVWACFDEPAVGAISALKDAERSDVKVYAIDGLPPAFDAIRDGTLTATAWINAYGAGTDIGNSVPKIVAAGVNGKPLEKVAPSVLVDRSSLDAFLEKYPIATAPAGQ